MLAKSLEYVFLDLWFARKLIFYLHYSSLIPWMVWGILNLHSKNLKKSILLINASMQKWSIITDVELPSCKARVLYANVSIAGIRCLYPQLFRGLPSHGWEWAVITIFWVHGLRVGSLYWSFHTNRTRFRTIYRGMVQLRRLLRQLIRLFG